MKSASLNAMDRRDGYYPPEKAKDLKKKISPHFRVFRRGLGRKDTYLTKYSTKEVNGSNVSL